MLCPNCGKTIAMHDRFCRYCGQPVVVKSEPPKRPESGEVVFPIEGNDFGQAEILAPFESQLDTAWGAHIYTGSSQDSHQVKTRPEGCPEWVESSDWFRWFRRGLVVWDHSACRIGAILAGEAIDLLEKLQASDEWKTQGIALVERHTNWLILPEPPSRKRSRKKKNAGPEPAPPPEEPKSKPKFYEEERLHLTGRAAEEFVAYLRANEAQLRLMADEEEKLQQKADQRLFEIMVQWHHRCELEEFDGAGRKFPWVRQKDPLALVCDVPPDRGTIKLSDDGMSWQPIIEQPNYLKLDYERFLLLREALDWVEQKLPELRAEDEERTKMWEREEAEEKAKIAGLPKKDLTHYWIDPSALEPKRITYRVIIELEYEPYSFKKTEISFGQFWRSDKEFYPPTLLARELRLAPNQVDIEQLSQYLGLYDIRSAVTYYEAPIAAAQAQRLWEHRAVGERYEQKQVIRARYGFEEVETEYCVWLGGFEKPDNPWPAPETRAEYLARCAMRETLLYALDVNGYRQYQEMPYKYVSDEQLVESIHKARAKSRYLTAEARAESQRWLGEQAQDT